MLPTTNDRESETEPPLPSVTVTVATLVPPLENWIVPDAVENEFPPTLQVYVRESPSGSDAFALNENVDS